MHNLVLAALIFYLSPVDSGAVEFVAHGAQHRSASWGTIRLKRRAKSSRGRSRQDPDDDAAEADASKIIKEAEEEAASEEATSKSGPAPAPNNNDGTEAAHGSKASKQDTGPSTANNDDDKGKSAKSNKKKRKDGANDAADESERDLDHEVAKAEAEEHEEEKEDGNVDAVDYPEVSWKTEKSKETAGQRIHRREVEDLEHAIARETKSGGLAVMLGGLKLDMYQLQDQMDMIRKDVANGVRIEKKDPNDAFFYPVSTCMWCILMLTAQYFIVYGALATCKLFTEAFDLGETVCELSLKAACNTVFYAPMLSVLFLGAQLRAEQIAEGRQGPSPSCEMAMQVCVWSVLAQTFLVLAVPILTGGDKVASEADELGAHVPKMHDPALAGILTLVRYVAMASLLLGISVVCAEVVLMDARTLGVDPQDLWDDPTTGATEYAPPVSVAMTCTIFLLVFFFTAYLLRAIVQSIMEFTSASTPRQLQLDDPLAWVIEVDRCLQACANTMNLAPMLCILFVAARMRALQMDSKVGAQQAWAESCFYVCTAALTLNIGVIIIARFLGLGSVAFLSDSGRNSQRMGIEDAAGSGAAAIGTASEPRAAELPTTEEVSSGEKAVLALRGVALFVVFVASFGIVVSIFTIRAPEGKPTPAVSPTLQCVVFLAALYFAVYFGAFISQVIAAVGGQASASDSSATQQVVYSFRMAEYGVRFCPMLAVLFVGARMRALHMSAFRGSPQCWAQSGMYIAGVATFGQVMLALLVGGFASKAGDKAGSPVVVHIAKVMVLLALFGSVSVVCASVLAIRPESARCDNPHLLSPLFLPA